MKNRHTALSLVEVLVAAMIIAAAAYGVLLTLSAQQAVEVRQRNMGVLRQLHYQFVREILKNQRDTDFGHTLGQPAAAPGDWLLTSRMISGEALKLSYRTDTNYKVATTLVVLRDGNPAGTSSISFLYPYARTMPGWRAVTP
jgi:type II secretory pathway pseudopilin PulG